MVYLGVEGKDLEISFRYRHLENGGMVWFFADGDDGFGDTISYNPTFEDVEISPTERQQFEFDEEVVARFVKFIATDNYFEEPGDEDVFRKIREDFDNAGVDQSDHQIRRTMEELMETAIDQIKNES